MRTLKLDVRDLVWSVMTEEDGGFRAVPLLRNRIGPGSEAEFTIVRGYYPFPEELVANLVDPVAARLGPDLVLPGGLAVRDLVLLDQNPRVRSLPQAASGIWVVKDGGGFSVRYVRLQGGQVCVGNESNRNRPELWRVLPLDGRNILDIVRAKIVWIGREMETEPNRPAHPAG